MTSDDYQLSRAQREDFERDGYVHLANFVTESELRVLDSYYQRFVDREIEVAGRDFCDMSATYDADIESFAIVNIMLPGTYAPELRGNAYERRAKSVAEQLCGPDMVLDYDQLVAKRPQREDARFEWHQDLAYWPVTQDTRTASFWLALDDTSVENGCLSFVPRSHRESRLRPHRPMGADRDEAHTIVATIRDDDHVRPVPIRRGDVTVHHERTLHGSGGNTSAGWRRGWVVAYRARSCVEAERAMGFTHSHNDSVEVLNRVGREPS